MATPEEARAALRAFNRALPTAIIRGLRAGLRDAERFTKTRYMVRKDNRHPAVFDPPNPPPGPLAIRSGRLIRTVRIGNIKFDGRKIRGGLRAGGDGVNYAGHEFGMRAGRGRRSIIGARPYLRPGIRDAEPIIRAKVKKEMLVAARATLQTIARGL